MTLNPKLGELLVALGRITPEQLEEALAEQRRTGDRLGQVLLRKGLIKEEELAQVLADQQHAELVRPKQLEIDPKALALVDPRFARAHRVLPYRLEGNRLYVAMAHPSDLALIDELRYITGKEIVPKLAPDSEILEVLDQHRRTEPPAEAPEPPPALEAAPPDPAVGAAPAVQLADALLHEAIAAGASDLHLEPREHYLAVRLRIDGVLTEVRRVPKEQEPPLIARFKVLAQLNIAERRRPQDGHFTFVFEGRRHEVRLSTMGTLWGEKLVARIIYPTRVRIGLAELGMFPEDLARFETLLRRPYGILFVTGPTGSGKTTTLYAALEHIYTPARNFVTIEDPVEFPLEGINQIPVQPRLGLGFAEILRAILRQDPDVILVGEVRDAETLETALRAALTGHLVLATLHTNDAVSTVSRLFEMGAERYLVASTLIGAVAQRLVRRVCPQCGEWRPLSPEEAAFLGEAAPEAQRKGAGCTYCRGLGYKGRIGLFEIFAPDAELLRAIGQGADEAVLRARLQESGHRSLRDAGVRQVREGQTTVSELMRVIGMLEG